MQKVLLLKPKISTLPQNWYDIIKSSEEVALSWETCKPEILKEISLTDSAKYIPINMRTRGLYAIFTECGCFYVGISTNDMRGRLITHFRKDVPKNYGKKFKELENRKEIYICCWLDERCNTKKAKLSLSLMEGLISFKLNPEHLKDE